MIFKNRAFVRFAVQHSITDHSLCEAIDPAERGLIDADLGGGVIKQRIARPNEGKSGGFRTIIVFRAGEHTFFVYGFPKNQRANISAAEKTAFKELAVELFAYDDVQLKKAVEKGVFAQVVCP